jgi:hypothetical protein
MILKTISLNFYFNFELTFYSDNNLLFIDLKHLRGPSENCILNIVDIILSY